MSIKAAIVNITIAVGAVITTAYVGFGVVIIVADIVGYETCVPEAEANVDDFYSAEICAE